MYVYRYPRLREDAKTQLEDGLFVVDSILSCNRLICYMNASYVCKYCTVVLRDGVVYVCIKSTKSGEFGRCKVLVSRSDRTGSSEELEGWQDPPIHIRLSPKTQTKDRCTREMIHEDVTLTVVF